MTNPSEAPARHSKGNPLSFSPLPFPSCSPNTVCSSDAPGRHTGPVWQVAWAHPKFGHILASCSYDGKVIIWKDQQPASTGWAKIKEHSLHTASGAFLPPLTHAVLLIRRFVIPVNSVSWAPHELGAILACASSDGKISVLTFKGAGTLSFSLLSLWTIPPLPNLTEMPR